MKIVTKFAMALLLAAALTPSLGHATVVVCVSDAHDFGIDLVEWEGYTTDTVELRLIKGTYTLSAQDFSQEICQESYCQNGGGNVELRIKGGYTDASAADCGPRELLASNTVIDGHSDPNVVFYLAALNGLKIEGLTFANFAKSVQIIGDGNNVSIHDVIGSHLAPSDYDQIQIAIFADTATVDSVLVHDGSAPSGRSSLDISSWDGSTVEVKHVTVANNTGDGISLTTIKSHSYNTSPSINVDDAIIWGNTGTQVRSGSIGTAPPSISHSDYADSVGALTDDGTNLHSPPLFISSAAENYALQSMIAGWPADSPVINKGTASTTCSTCTDLSGNPRYVGSRVDMGAYESSVDDQNHLVVTTASDNGNNSSPTPGSLRAAIVNANAAAGPSTVTFGGNLTCPTMLAPPAPLPDITSDISIDATTLHGWKQNDDPNAFDANLCIYLDGNGSSTVPVGLHVPSTSGAGRLSVSGILFFGFSDAAVKLEGGANHRITGNQFSSAILTIPNQDGVRITANAGAAVVGGADDPSERNLFGGATRAGIYLDNAAGGSQVIGNIVGFRPDGTTADGNGIGIVVSQSPNNAVVSNVIGNSAGFGVQLVGSATTGNAVSSNSIGATAQGLGSGNAAGGVQIAAGAKGNTIGASAGASSVAGFNAISHNGGPGIWIPGGPFAGGTGNSVIANSVTANSGLAIDLGALGPTDNDVYQFGPGDQDTGPNDLQNYPAVIQAKRIPSPLLPGVTLEQVALSINSSANAMFRVDVYFSFACSQAGGQPARGEMSQFLGHTTLSTDGTGSATRTVTFAPPSGYGYISAVATSLNADASFGDTSEVGNCVPDDVLFSDGFD